MKKSNKEKDEEEEGEMYDKSQVTMAQWKVLTVTTSRSYDCLQQGRGGVK